MTKHRRPPSNAFLRAAQTGLRTFLGFACCTLATAASAQNLDGQAALHFPLTVEGARDAGDAGQVFLESAVERSTFYVHEPIRVTLRFGVAEDFRRASLLPLFRPPMDLPVQLQAAWMAGLDGAKLGTPQPEAESDNFALQSFVLNDELSRAHVVPAREIDGRLFRVFEIERTFFANSPGELLLPVARLRFAFATRFEDTFLAQNVPADRIEAFVQSEVRALTILALPEAGRPSDFSGAVGALRLRSELGAHELDFGSSLKLKLHIEGEGNLEFFDAPRIEPLDGWRVLGTIEARSARLRTIEYDLAPRSAQVQRLPPIAFSFFDPTPPGQYRTLRTDAQDVRVRAQPAAAGGSAPTAEQQDPQPPQRRLWLWIAAEAVALLAALWFVRARLAARRRGSIAPRPSTDSPRVRAAVARLRAQSGAADVELMPDFAEYLAARLQVAPSAALDTELEQRLLRAGVPRELAARTQAWVTALVAVRYGGAATQSGAQQAARLLDELEAAFDDPGAPLAPQSSAGA